MVSMKQPGDPERTGLIWFRNSLRLEDNTAVYHALCENEAVACLFVLDDTYLRGPEIGAARAAFLRDSLVELSAEIASHGGQLILRLAKDVPAEVVTVAKEVGAGRIYINEDYLPYPIRRDARVQSLAQAEGIELRSYRDSLLVDPRRVLTEKETPYTVFTPFKRRWENLLETPERYAVETRLPAMKRARRIAGAELPELSHWGLILRQQIEPGGAKRAQARLTEFVTEGLPNYHQNRDFCADPNSTSRLSMHIKWGTLSLRDCYRAARAAGGPGADKWIDELTWREFYHAVVFYFPHVLEGPMLREYANFPWSENREHLEAWKAGETGYPFVDAGMRQLNTTGWMHNRLRQVVASYLCKDLAIHWQEGERYFMQMLVDGDWPSNNGGWQWVAGCGTDPRRATRIFNPALQQERYDPRADYIRQWIPEYGRQRYPDPIVLHEQGRAQYLERFRKARSEGAAGPASDGKGGQLGLLL